MSERDRARRAEQEATKSAQEAKDQRRFAEAARGEAEHNLYAASMNLAQGAWDQGNIDRLRGILDATRTYSHRGFEWFYWQRQTHLELRTLRGHEVSVSSVAFSSDGRRILTGSWDATAKVWDAETGRELLTLKGHTSWVTSVASSPDGPRILTGSWDATAKIWDAETGREHFTLKGHTSSVSSIAFSYDGRRILTGSYDNTAKVWMAASPEEAEAWLKEQPEWQQKVEEQEKRKLRTLMADLDSAITQKN